MDFTNFGMSEDRKWLPNFSKNEHGGACAAAQRTILSDFTNFGMSGERNFGFPVISRGVRGVVFAIPRPQRSNILYNINGDIYIYISIHIYIYTCRHTQLQMSIITYIYNILFYSYGIDIPAFPTLCHHGAVVVIVVLYPP